MKKKLLACIMAVAMTLGLAACGAKEPTAQELMDSVRDMEMSGYTDVTMKMKVSGKTDGVDADIDLDASVETSGDIMHIYDMEMGIGTEGFNMAVKMEGWIDQKSEKGYMNMSLMGMESGWMAEDMNSSDEDPAAGMSDLMNSVQDLGEGEEPTLKEHKKGEDYVVTWTVKSKDMKETIGALAEDYTDVTFGDAVAEATFDAETKQIKSISVKSDAETDGDSADIEVMFIFNTLNGDKELEIPEEVIEEAKTNDGNGFGFNFGGDDDTEDPGAGTGMLPGIGSDAGGDTNEHTEMQPDATDGEGHGLHNDGDGEDAYIDNLGAKLAADYPDSDVYVYHYSSESTVSWYPETNMDWSGDIEVNHVTDTEWTTAEHEFTHNVEFLTEWYGQEPRDKDANNAIFIQEDNGTLTLDYNAYDGDVYIEATVHVYNDLTEEDAMGYLAMMLEAVGVE